MTGYERIVREVSIRRADRAANRRVLKSMSDIAYEVSESADMRDDDRLPRAMPGAPMPGAPLQCIRTDELQPARIT
ncbi:hypothetical protein DIE06_03850 [Burkholderia sp. Bp8998]|nr:hypothetical protein DIE06_03850 [Burkholderia sp. Bp8998]